METEMACKYCGLQWKKDVTAQELIEEVNVRRKMLKEARSSFFEREWPGMAWRVFSPLWLTLAYMVVILMNLITFNTQIDHFIDANLGMLGYLMVVIFSPAALILFISTLVVVRKKHRLLRKFREEYLGADVLLEHCDV